MTEPLTPSAQAVLDAADEAIREWPPIWENAIAAALRAAADQVVPPALEEEFYNRNSSLRLLKAVEIRGELLAIADELEAHQ